VFIGQFSNVLPRALVTESLYFSMRPISILSSCLCLGFPISSFPFTSSYQSSACISCLLFDNNPNNIKRRMQIMKPLQVVLQSSFLGQKSLSHSFIKFSQIVLQEKYNEKLLHVSVVTSTVSLFIIKTSRLQSR
jgi:hypothetical protein